MIGLMTAIKTRFDAALISQFPGGLYLVMAPDMKNLPVCVAEILDGDVDYQTAEAKGSAGPVFTYLESSTVVFTVYATDGDFCLNVLDILAATFDHASMTIPNERFIAGRRSGGMRLLRSDERVAQGEITFKFEVQRQLGS